MKTKLLFTFLIATQQVSAQYYISEIEASPPNTNNLGNYSGNTAIPDHQVDSDYILEYFEFRGTANTTIPADVYFVAIDGDDENPGRVQDAIELSDLSFGSNGILAIVANVTMDTGALGADGVLDISGTKFINPYATALAASGANVSTIELTASTIEWTDEDPVDGVFETINKFNISSKTPEVDYDGSIIDQNATYMIVQTTPGEGNPDGLEIDSDANGVFDGLATGWTIYDGVSILDDDDPVEFAYSEMIFLEAPGAVMPDLILTNDPALTPTIVLLDQYPNYVARQGLKTGNACTTDGVNNDDWMAGRINSGSYPDWKFSSNALRNVPSEELTGSTLSGFDALTLGEANVDLEPILSVGDFSSNEFVLYPNPANHNIIINSKNNIKLS